MAAMVEVAIVYGNRYRSINKNVDIEISKSEEMFYNGDYKKALDTTIRAINTVEPGISEKLFDTVKQV